MAYNQTLADRIRLYLADKPGLDIEEKQMMGGLTVMVNGKMCVGIIKDDLMVRLDPLIYKDSLKKSGVKPLTFTGRVSKGFILVEPKGVKDDKSLAYWLGVALDFNKYAKASKKRK